MTDSEPEEEEQTDIPNEPQQTDQPTDPLTDIPIDPPTQPEEMKKPDPQSDPLPEEEKKADPPTNPKPTDQESDSELDEEQMKFPLTGSVTFWDESKSSHDFDLSTIKTREGIV